MMLREAIHQERTVDPDVYARRIERLIARRARLGDAEVRAIMMVLAALRRRLAEDLLAVNPTDGVWRAAQLGQLRAAIDRAAADFASRYGSALTGAVNTGWELGAAFPAQSMAAANVTTGFPLEISRIQLEVVSQMHMDLVRAVTNDFRVRAGREITLGVAGGKSPFQVMGAIGELLRTEPRRGEMGTIAIQAERIVRTEMGRAFSVADRVRTEEIARDVPGLRHYWASSRDGRVREAHAQADMRYRPGGSPGPIPIKERYTVGGERMLYPHDPNGSAANVIQCRCLDLKYMKEWFR